MPPPRSELGDRLAAALGERYVVEHEAGSGGMAIVFAARDIRHNRRVAIKTLRPELVASVGDVRFLQEIELAAGLQHPHILPIYDSGAADGLLYYVMPFVDGEALSTRIARTGALPLDEAVRLAREVASALGYAHERGIIHRDIKPDNILLGSGHALVADFGIARAVASTNVRLTATGMAVGTPLYMSPEQALGAADVDSRADIYSLGCVLYEMLTGQQPFAGSSLQAIVAQSITAPRPRIRKLRPDAPAALDVAVTTAMAREPGDRFATATAMGEALAGAWGGARPARSRRRMALAAALVTLGIGGAAWAWQARSHDAREAPVAADARVIAVLPFTAVGGERAGADGVAEGLVDLFSTNLDGVGGIRTIDPHAVLKRWRAQAGGERSVDRSGALAIGRLLGAGSVLTGDVVTVGARVRLSAELTSVAGEILARGQADGAAESMLALVDSLSVRLLRDVWRASSPLPELRVSAFTTGSLPAMRAYLEGESQIRRSDWAGASRSFRQAIEQDSSFALAYLRLISAYAWLGVDVQARQAVGAQLARRLDRLSARERGLAVGTMLREQGSLASADTALALTVRYPDDIDGWLLLGEARYHGRALLASTDEEVRAPFERALALDSTHAWVYEHLLDIDALAGDSVRFTRDLSRLRAITAAAGSERYAGLGTALWGTGEASGLAMRTFAQRDDALFQVLVRSSVAVPGAAARLTEVLGRMAGPVSDSLLPPRVALLLSAGRLEAASALAIEGLARSPDAQPVYTYLLLPLGTGLDERRGTLATLRAGARHFNGRPFGRLLTAEIGIVTGDSALVHETVAASLALGNDALAPRLRAVMNVLLPWERLARGDSAAGAVAVGEALRRTDFTLSAVTVQARLARAIALSRRAPTRVEGGRLLRYGFLDDPATFAVRQLALLESQLAGQDPGAVGTRAVVARVWASADPAARAAAQRSFPRAFAP